MRAVSRDPGSETASFWSGLHVPAGGGASRGPAGLSLRICSMGRPVCAPPGGPGARRPRSALLRDFWGPGSHILGGRAHPAGARDCHPRAGCPLKDEKMASGTAPAGTEWPRTCGGPETGFVTARGGSPKQELERAGRGHHPTCPRPAQVRSAQVRPRAAAREPFGAPRPGLGNREAAGQLSALGRPQGTFHLVTVRGPAACSFGPIQALGGDQGSGSRDAFRPPGCESLCKPFIVTVIFARMSHPGGAGRCCCVLSSCCCCCCCNIFEHLLLLGS